VPRAISLLDGERKRSKGDVARERWTGKVCARVLILSLKGTLIYPPGV
jgi:hypothetical protein